MTSSHPAAAGAPLRRSDEIQGDVLTPLRAGHAAFLFLRFGDPGRARRWIAELLPRVATTRAVVEWDEAHRPAGVEMPVPTFACGGGGAADGGDMGQCGLAAVWITMSLTARGIIALAPTLARDVAAFPGFRDGPAKRAALLGDEGRDAPAHWVLGNRAALIDAMLAVEADLAGDRDRVALELAAEAAAWGLDVLRDERGDVLPGRLRGHEHFGFRDCISQPGVVGFHVEDRVRPGERAGSPGVRLVAAGEFVLGHPRRDGTVRAHPAWMAHGSFRVFRRLVQDVAGWRRQLTDLCAALPPSHALTEDALAARLIGRWPSGVPLAHAPEADPGAAACDHLNDFDFSADPHGFVTPHFAHVRKMHPRGEAFYDDRRRVIRRGVPFGPPYDVAPDAERGLLFQAFMASIEDQFEFLQRLWANTDDFPCTGAGADALIGVARPPAPAILRRSGRLDHPVSLERCVRTTGAAYLFTPSLSTLARLAGDGG